MTERTNEEIIARLREIDSRDALGFESGDLMIRLPLELAREFLKPEYDGADWKVYPRDRESVIAGMLNYMPFAWEKANNCRGISAYRTLCHYTSWLWLIGEDLGDLLSYEFYGKPQLIAICERFGWDHKQWDDGRRRNTDID
jgi:hypothetical protein